MTPAQTAVVIIIIVLIVVIIIYFITCKSADEVVVQSATPYVFGAPQNLTAEASDSTIHLKWEPIPGAEFYTIYYSPQSFNGPEEASVAEKKIQVLKPIAKPDVKITSMAKGSHNFMVTATKNVRRHKLSKKVQVESSPTKLQTVRVDVCTTPEPPKNLKLEAKNQKDDTFDVHVTWAPVAKAEGYIVCANVGSPPKGDSSDSHRFLIGEGMSTGYLLKGLSKGAGDLYVAVSAFEQHCGPGQLSQPVEMKLRQLN